MEWSLRNNQRELREELREHLAVVAAGHPVAELGSVFEELTASFAALACCRLLIDAAVGDFCDNLTWAAYTRRFFLRQHPQNRGNQVSGAPDLYLARSRCQSLFCALSAGQKRLAAELAQLSWPDWIKDGEYEDDFEYHLFISQAINDPTAAACEQTLSRFQTSLQGHSTPRYDVCVALFERSVEGFGQAFDALLAQRMDELEKQKPLFANDVKFRPSSAVFVEGLALLELARHGGLLVPRRDYPLCPEIAQLPANPRQTPDVFAEFR